MVGIVGVVSCSGGKKMTKPQELKKGDRVVMLEPEDGNNDPPRGTKGTFIQFDGTHYDVDWDERDVHGVSAWWMERKQLRKLPEAKR